jgi:hypothetical protein
MMLLAQNGGDFMLVKDVLKLCADYLDFKEVKEYLNDSTQIAEDIKDDLNDLLLAVNLVNANLAANYFELVKTIKYDVPILEFEYGELSKDGVIEVKSIVDVAGNILPFVCLPDRCRLERAQPCSVTFSYFPSKVTIDSDINYYSKLNDVTFAMGVVAEYLFIKGSIDDAYMWDKRFKSSILGVSRPKRSIILPAREWV